MSSSFSFDQNFSSDFPLEFCSTEEFESFPGLCRSHSCDSSIDYFTEVSPDLPILSISSLENSAVPAVRHTRSSSESKRRVSAFFSAATNADFEADISDPVYNSGSLRSAPRVQEFHSIEEVGDSSMLAIQESEIEILPSDPIEFALVEGQESRSASDDEFYISESTISHRLSVSEIESRPFANRRKSSSFLDSLNAYISLADLQAPINSGKLPKSRIPKLDPLPKALRSPIPQSAVERVKAANRALRAGNFSLCAEECAAALSIAPLYPNAYFSCALASSSRGDYHSVVFDCSFFLELTAESPTAAQLDKVLYNRALAFYMIDEFGQALEDFQQLLAMRPGFALAHTGQGNVFMKLQQFEKGISELRRGAEIEPGESTIMPLAVGLATAGNFAESVELTSRVLAANPKCAAALFHRGACYLKLREFALGIVDYSAALAIEPTRTEAIGKRGACFIQCGEFEKALKDFLEVLKHKPDDLIAQNAVQFCREQIDNPATQSFLAENVLSNRA